MTLLIEFIIIKTILVDLLSLIFFHYNATRVHVLRFIFLLIFFFCDPNVVWCAYGVDLEVLCVGKKSAPVYPYKASRIPCDSVLFKNIILRKIIRLIAC